MTVMGYAYVAGNEIDVRTVCDTERAAMVNAICLAGRLPTNKWSDEKIRRTFAADCPGIVLQVRIELLESEGS